MNEQLQFPFPSMDFPGRTTLTVQEIAEKLNATPQHVLNLIESGALGGLNTPRDKEARRMIRITVEQYRNFIIRSLTNPDDRLPFYLSLPKATVRQLRDELTAFLNAS